MKNVWRVTPPAFLFYFSGYLLGGTSRRGGNSVGVVRSDTTPKHAIIPGRIVLFRMKKWHLGKPGEGDVSPGIASSLDQKGLRALMMQRVKPPGLGPWPVEGKWPLRNCQVS